MEVQQKVLWLPCVASGVVKTNMTPNRRAQEKVLSLPCVASGVMKTNMSAKLVALVSDKQNESPKDESSSSAPENEDWRHHYTDNKAILD